jgi:hypothetical protein
VKNGYSKRKIISRARHRILAEARRKGYVTNAMAKKTGGFQQAWFHLNAMVEAGALEYSSFNRWVPAKPRKKTLEL